MDGIVAPAGYVPTNPSVTEHRGELWMMVRCVNYRIVGSEYRRPDPESRTRNILCRLGRDLRISHQREVKDLDPAPRVACDALGYEDARLFSHLGKLAASASACDRERGKTVIVLLELSDEGDIVAARRPFCPTPVEKNWMPITDGPELRWVYSTQPRTIVVGKDGRVVEAAESGAPEPAVLLSGGSQLLPWQDGWIAVCHEKIERLYYQRLVFFDRNFCSTKSMRWHFQGPGIEFGAGIARRPDVPGKIVLSWGLYDAEAWLTEVDEGELDRLLESSGGTD